MGDERKTAGRESLFDALHAYIEGCRDLGRGALSADLPTNYREVALDHFDRQIDNILGGVDLLREDDYESPAADRSLQWWTPSGLLERLRDLLLRNREFGW